MMESNRFKLVFDESLEKIKLKELRERMERINDHYELGEIDDEN